MVTITEREQDLQYNELATKVFNEILYSKSKEISQIHHDDWGFNNSLRIKFNSDDRFLLETFDTPFDLVLSNDPINSIHPITF